MENKKAKNNLLKLYRLLKDKDSVKDELKLLLDTINILYGK
jgi:hypothetical protein